MDIHKPKPWHGPREFLKCLSRRRIQSLPKTGNALAGLVTTSVMLAGSTSVTAGPNSYFRSGNDLLRECTADLRTQTGQASRMACAAYVTGAADSEAWLGPELKKLGKTPGICAPDHVEVGQAVEIVTAYLQAHPDKRASNASTLVVVALFAAWPCPNNGSGS